MFDTRRSAVGETSSLVVSALGLAGTALLVRAAIRHTRRYELRNRVVLIAGGSRGLGLVLARQLAAAGARVAICGRDQLTLARAHRELLRISSTAYSYVADLTQEYDIRSLVQRVTSEVGPIDVLINNAATLQLGPAQLMTEDDYRQALDTIFWSAYHMTEAVLPVMRKRGTGRIVNISSVGGLLPAPHLAPYVAAKHALTGYSRAMHNELKRDGIHVTTVNPGLMRTGSPQQITVKGNHQAEYAWFKIADSLPLTSMSADRAARAIVNALSHGDAELTLTLSAKLGARVQALFPNLSARFGAALNRALPAPTTSAQTRRGYEAESSVTRSVLGRLTDRAAERNNETSPS